MGMRIDLVDKDIYTANPVKGKLMSGSDDRVNEETTNKMLEDLKQRLISVRDKFILSDKETLPDHLFAKNEASSTMVKSDSVEKRSLIRQTSSSLHN